MFKIPESNLDNIFEAEQNWLADNELDPTLFDGMNQLEEPVYADSARNYVTPEVPVVIESTLTKEQLAIKIAASIAAIGISTVAYRQLQLRESSSHNR